LRRAIFAFLFLLPIMLVLRLIHKQEQFQATDLMFVFLFASAMAVFEYFRAGKTEL
jgi:hypothetical protein